MKLTPDDPRLSAYVLGELSADDAAEVKRAAAADPAIRMSLRELEKTTGWLADTLGAGGEKRLMPAQRQAVLAAARDADARESGPAVASPSRPWRSWLSGLAAAAVIALAAVLLSRLGPAPAEDRWAVAEEVALLPMPGPSVPGGGTTHPAAGGDASGEQRQQLEERPSEFLGEIAERLNESELPDPAALPPTGDEPDFSAAESMRLPVLVGTSSFDWVRRWVRERNALPPRHAVRVEEMINATTLESRPWIDGLSLGIEHAACPWNEEAVLIGIQLEAGDAAVEDLRLFSRGEARRRVLGSFSRRSDEALATTLPAGRANLVILEIAGGPENWGELVLRRGEDEVFVRLSEEAKPATAAMRHSVAMAGFGRWLRGEVPREVLVEALDAASAMEQPPTRRDDLGMIREALALDAPTGR